MPQEAVYNELVLLHSPEAGVRQWELSISPIFAEGGYQLTQREPEELRYTRRYSPGWAIVVAVLLFPIGLLALMAKSESTLFLSFEAYGTGTLVKVTGTASRKTKNWLDGLAADMNERARQGTEETLAGHTG